MGNHEGAALPTLSAVRKKALKLVGIVVISLLTTFLGTTFLDIRPVVSGYAVCFIAAGTMLCAVPVLFGLTFGVSNEARFYGLAIVFGVGIAGITFGVNCWIYHRQHEPDIEFLPVTSNAASEPDTGASPDPPDEPGAQKPQPGLEGAAEITGQTFGSSSPGSGATTPLPKPEKEIQPVRPVPANVPPIQSPPNPEATTPLSPPEKVFQPVGEVPEGLPPVRPSPNPEATRPLAGAGTM